MRKYCLVVILAGMLLLLIQSSEVTPIGKVTYTLTQIFHGLSSNITALKKIPWVNEHHSCAILHRINPLFPRGLSCQELLTCDV